MEVLIISIFNQKIIFFKTQFNSFLIEFSSYHYFFLNHLKYNIFKNNLRNKNHHMVNYSQKSSYGKPLVIKKKLQ